MTDPNSAQPLDIGLVAGVLTQPQFDVVRRHYGLDGEDPLSFTEIGRQDGVTRQNAHRIEREAMERMRQSSVMSHLWSIIARDFAAHDGSLVRDGQSATPSWNFVRAVLQVEATYVPELDLYCIGDNYDVNTYRKNLRRIRNNPEMYDGNPVFGSVDGFNALSAPDQEHLHVVEREYAQRYVDEKEHQESLTRHGVVVAALRSLGRAAHFDEIISKVYELFPDCTYPAGSLKGFLITAGHPDNEHLGIVWTRRRGTYGLAEHGYVRPGLPIFDEVVRVVEDTYEATGESVSLGAIEREMNRRRQVPVSSASVSIAAGLSDQLTYVAGGRFVPSRYVEDTESEYNMGSAISTFLGERGQDPPPRQVRGRNEDQVGNETELGGAVGNTEETPQTLPTRREPIVRRASPLWQVPSTSDALREVESRPDIIGIGDFYRAIPDESAAVAFAEEMIWVGLPECPRCDSRDVYRVENGRPMSHRCLGCGQYYSVRTNTMMEGSYLPIHTWLFAIHLIHSSRQGISSCELARQLGITQKTAWFLGHRIRAVMKDDYGVDNAQATGVYAVSKGGDLPANGSRDRRLQGQVVIDGARGSDSKVKVHPTWHDDDDFGPAPQANDDTVMNGVRSFWGLLQRGYVTFRHVDGKYADYYLDEFASRHNAGLNNGFNTIGRILRQSVGKRLTHEELVTQSKNALAHC